MKIFLAAAAVLAATFTQAADAEPQKDVVPQIVTPFRSLPYLAIYILAMNDPIL